MKRISIISPHFRGPRHRLENIALSLREKFEVHLFIFSSDVPRNRRYKMGEATFSYIKIPIIVRKLRLYYLFHVPIILLSALKADILFTNEAYKTASVAGLICKITRKKLILFYGTLYFEELKLHSRSVSSIPRKFKTRLYKTMELVSTFTVDTIISPDRRVASYFHKHMSKPKVTNWFNVGTVNTEKFRFNPATRREYREELSIPRSDVVLLFVGALSRRDGADMALEVFKRIKDCRSDAWLVMIGPGASDFLGRLKQIVATRKISNVVFTGNIPHASIQNYMMVADLAILPYQEPNCGIGNVVVELMSLGIPIVASNYSEIKTVLINGETGFVAENEDDFVEKTKLLMDNSNLRQRIRENCRKYAIRNFSYDAFSEKLEYIIEGLKD